MGVLPCFACKMLSLTSEAEDGRAVGSSFLFNAQSHSSFLVSIKYANFSCKRRLY